MRAIKTNRSLDCAAPMPAFALSAVNCQIRQNYCAISIFFYANIRIALTFLTICARISI